jgi:plastocyanin
MRRDGQVLEPFRRSVAAQDRSLRIQDHHALVGGPQPEIPFRVVTQVLDHRVQAGGQAYGFHPAVVRVDPGQQGGLR